MFTFNRYTLTYKTDIHCLLILVFLYKFTSNLQNIVIRKIKGVLLKQFLQMFYLVLLAT